MFSTGISAVKGKGSWLRFVLRDKSISYAELLKKLTRNCLIIRSKNHEDCQLCLKVLNIGTPSTLKELILRRASTYNLRGNWRYSNHTQGQLYKARPGDTISRRYGMHYRMHWGMRLIDVTQLHWSVNTLVFIFIIFELRIVLFYLITFIFSDFYIVDRDFYCILVFLFSFCFRKLNVLDHFNKGITYLLYSLAAFFRKIFFSPLKNKIHIFAPPWNILSIYYSTSEFQPLKCYKEYTVWLPASDSLSVTAELKQPQRPKKAGERGEKAS